MVLATRTSGRARLLVLLAIGVIATGLPLTFSRAPVLALVPMLALLAIRRQTRWVAIALVTGLAVGASLGVDGIAARSEHSVEAGELDTGRRQRLEEAGRLLSEDPVFGVGPGRYVIALGETVDDTLVPAHNIVAQTAAESGVVGGFLMTAVIATFCWWLVRQRWTVVAAGLALLPIHMLDPYAHVFPTGIVATGFWLATVAIALDGGQGRAESSGRVLDPDLGG